jgi:hypothetical protein
MERLKHPVSKVMASCLAATALLGCGPTGPELRESDPAVVVGKEYDDRDVWISYIPTGKSLIPITNVDPEHYYLVVSQCGHPDFMDETTDGCGDFTVEVNQDTYEQFNNGDSIQFKGDE